MTKSTQFNGAARLLVQIAVILVTVAIGWGIIRQQVIVNADDIEKKLDKAVFQMYCEQQKTASEKTDRFLEKMDGKLDRIIEGGP